MNINGTILDCENQIFGHLELGNLVLRRLGVRDLMRSKLVCKNWNQLINKGLGTWFNIPSNKEFAAQVLLQFHCSQNKELVAIMDKFSPNLGEDDELFRKEKNIIVANIIDNFETIYMEKGVPLLIKGSFSFPVIVEFCRVMRTDVVKNVLSIEELIIRIEKKYYDQLRQGELDNAEGVSENPEHTDGTKGESLSLATKLFGKFFDMRTSQAIPDEKKEKFKKMKNRQLRQIPLLVCKKFRLKELKGMLSFLESSIGVDYIKLKLQISTEIQPQAMRIYQTVTASEDFEGDFSVVVRCPA